MSVLPNTRHASPRVQAWIVAGLMAAILAIAGLVLTSIYLREYTRNVCTSLNHGFSYVNDLNTQRIAGLERSIKTDTKAGRKLKVADSRKSLDAARKFQRAISPPDC